MKLCEIDHSRSGVRVDYTPLGSPGSETDHTHVPDMTDTHSQPACQTDRQTDRQTACQTDRQTDRQTYPASLSDRQTDTHTRVCSVNITIYTLVYDVNGIRAWLKHIFVSTFAVFTTESGVSPDVFSQEVCGPNPPPLYT